MYTIDTNTTHMPLENLNNFVKVKKLSRGGQGEVVLIKDKSTQNLYAMKTYFGHFDPAAFKEIEVLQTVQHPNIVQYYNHYINPKGSCSLILEYIEGNSLENYITQSSTLSLPQQLDIVYNTTLGLQALHQKNLIHCDIKPQNILVSIKDTTITTRLADFGIVVEDSSGKTSILQNFNGTAFYMPPESYAHEGVVRKPSTDIYALGMVLYEVIAQRLPFDKALSPDFFAHMHNDTPFPSITTYAPDTPQALANIIDTCIHKNRKERYQTLDLFLEKYTQFISQDPLEFSSVSINQEDDLKNIPKSVYPKNNSAQSPIISKKSKFSHYIPRIALGIGIATLIFISGFLATPAPSGPPPKTKKDVPQESPFSQGLSAFNQNDYQKAKKIFESIQKHPEALYHLGLIYENGYGVSKNLKQAIHYYKASAYKDNVNAMMKIAKLFTDDTAPLDAYITKLVWLEKAAKHENVEAMYKLGKLHLEKEEPEKALIWLNKAIDHHHIPATQQLVKYYSSQLDEYPHLLDNCIKLQLQLAQNNNIAAMLWLGDLYTQSPTNYKDAQKGYQWYKKAALLDNDKAMLELGIIYQNGINGQKDTEKALTYFVNAYKKGNIKASRLLGDFYSEFDSTKLFQASEHIEKAMIYYEHAAKNNDKDAIKSLAQLHMTHFKYGDFHLAKKWYDTLCGLGSSQALSHVRKLNTYLQLHRINQNRLWNNLPKKLKQLGKLAKDGEPQAQHQLAQQYLKREKNTTRNVENALFLLRSAALQKHIPSMYQLGFYYYKGKYVKQNFTFSYSFFNQCAQNQHAKSLYYAGLMTYNGQGVPKNLIKSKKYFEEAANLGNEKSKQLLSTWPKKK